MSIVKCENCGRVYDAEKEKDYNGVCEDCAEFCSSCGTQIDPDGFGINDACQLCKAD